MVVVSLRVTMGVLNAFVVAAVAAVTLGITLSVSFSAVRSIGTRHSNALADSAHTQLEAFLDFPAITADVLRNMTYIEQWPLPSTDPDFTLVRWQDIVRNSYFADELQAAGVHVMMIDGTYIYAVPSVRRPLFILHTQFPSIVNGSLLTSDSLYYTRDLTEVAGSSLPDELAAVSDVRSNSAIAMMNNATNGSRNVLWDAQFSTVLFTDGAIRYARAVNTALRTADNAIYGYACVSIFFDRVSTILRSVRGTANTFAFAIDGEGYLVGSSHAAPWVFEKPLPPSKSLPPGCTMTGTSSIIGLQTPVKVTCRHHVSDYPYAPLNDATQDRVQVFGSKRATWFMASGGDSYFAVTDPIAVRYPPLRTIIVLLMPESDVVGEIIAGRNLTIGVTAAVFVIVAAMSVFLIWLLLRPLSEIARRMLKAASLQDDEEPQALSLVTEIRSLQEAYHSMNAELKRIRSFVPQSLLQSNQNQTPTSEEDTFDSLLERQKGGDVGATRGHGATGGLHSDYAQYSRGTPTDRRSGTGSTNSSINNVSSVRFNDDATWYNDPDEDPDEALFGPIPIAATRGNAADAMEEMATASQRSVREKLELNMLPQVAALHSAIGVRGEHVTVFAANLTGFHAACKSLTHDDIALRIRTTVDCVYRAVSEHRGVLERFNGDHFFASFNASRPCPSHQCHAVAAALALTTAKTYGGFGLKWRIGIAFSKAFVGNLGSDDIKAYNVIGSAVTHAMALEKLAKVYRRSGVLVPHRMFATLRHRFAIRAVDVVGLPGLTRPTVIGEVLPPIQGITESVGFQTDADVNWLYETNDANTVSLAERNRFFELVAKRDANSAETLLRDLEQRVYGSRLKSDDTPALALQRVEMDQYLAATDVSNLEASIVSFAQGVAARGGSPGAADDQMADGGESMIQSVPVPHPLLGPPNAALVDTPTMRSAIESEVPRLVLMRTLLQQLRDNALEHAIEADGERKPSVFGLYYDCAIVQQSSQVDARAVELIAELERQGKLLAPPDASATKHEA